RLASAHRAAERAAGPRTRGLGGPGNRRARRFTGISSSLSCPHTSTTRASNGNPPTPEGIRIGDGWGCLIARCGGPHQAPQGIPARVGGNLHQPAPPWFRRWAGKGPWSEAPQAVIAGPSETERRGPDARSTARRAERGEAEGRLAQRAGPGARQSLPAALHAGDASRGPAVDKEGADGIDILASRSGENRTMRERTRVSSWRTRACLLATLSLIAPAAGCHRAPAVSFRVEVPAGKSDRLAVTLDITGAPREGLT